MNLLVKSTISGEASMHLAILQVQEVDDGGHNDDDEEEEEEEEEVERKEEA